MVEDVLKELELVANSSHSNNVATSLGNSHMIASCLNLL